MGKKLHETNQRKNPALTKPRQEVSTFLQERIKKGQEILLLDIRSESELANANIQKEKWQKFNFEYLKHCFDTDRIAEEYDDSDITSIYSYPSLDILIDSFKHSLKLQITSLESIIERLPLFEETATSEPKSIQKPLSGTGKVFIVHGHNEALKQKVARFVKKIGLKEIILDEQPNAGMTVIEKFEQHAKSAQYAIVLLTHDDFGYPKNSPGNKKPRARQNAIAELGYFRHALGKKNIAILCSEQIEMPSDFHGVLYIPVQEDDSWELRLAKEMKAAGLNIDLNNLLSN